MTELTLRHTPINDIGCQNISRFEHLERLDLSHTPVNDLALAPLSSLNRVVFLELADTKIGDNSMNTIAKMGSVVELNLANTAVTTVGIEKLADGLNPIMELSLSGTKVKVDDKLVKALSRMPAILLLEIEHVNLSDNDIRRLRQALPNANISTDKGLFEHINKPVKPKIPGRDVV